MNNNFFTTPNNFLDVRRQEIAQQAFFNSLVTNRTSKQIDDPKGQLVKQHNPIVGTAVAIKDTGKDVVNLKNALVTGKSDDHSLGRMNDLGLKIGGLSIAGLLAASAPTKAIRTMAVVGFGSFMASMTLWPKLFIDMPIQMRFGFNPRQKYIDSQGRKKEYYQDNQYQPRDLYDSPEGRKKLHKEGDRLGIPRDIQDREELIHEKKRVIALQANTLWMWTAGIMTPVMTALGCNAIERVVKKGIMEQELKYAKNALADIDTTSAKVFKSGFDNANKGALKDAFDTFLKSPEEGSKKIANVSLEEGFKKIANVIDPTNLKDATFLSDVGNKSIFSEVANFEDALVADLKALHNHIGAVGTDDKSAFAIIKKVIQDNGIKPERFDIDDYKDLKALKSEWGIAGDKFTPQSLLSALEQNLGLKKLAEGSEDALKSVFGKTPEEVNKEFVETVKKFYYGDTDELKGAGVKGVKARLTALANSVNAFVGDKAESLTARRYHEAQNEIFKALSLNEAQRTLANSEKGTIKVLGDFFADLGKEGNEGAYKHFVGKMSSLFIKDDEVKEIAKNVESASETVTKAFGSVFNMKDIPEDSMKNLKSLLSEDSTIVKSFFDKAKLGKLDINSILSRQIVAADFEKRVALGKITGEKLIKQCREIIYTANANGISNKSYMDISNEYKLAYETLFDVKNMLPETIKALGGSDSKNVNFVNKFIEGFKAVANAAQDRACPNHSLDCAANAESPLINYIKVAQSPADMLRGAVETIGNDRNWLKIFGSVAVGVVALTLVSQAFFGKVKDQEHYQKKGAVNAN